MLVDVPGLDEESLQVNIKQGMLIIEAQVQSAAGTILSREFSFTGYQRQFQLPETLDAEAVSAEVKSGVLRLLLPKVKAARPHRVAVTVH